jgi:hypothetical protein
MNDYLIDILEASVEYVKGQENYSLIEEGVTMATYDDISEILIRAGAAIAALELVDSDALYKIKDELESLR